MTITLSIIILTSSQETKKKESRPLFFHKIIGMSRKIQKLRMLREGQRKSPRISGLDVWRAQQRSNNAIVVTQQQQSRCNAALKKQKNHDRDVDLVKGGSESKEPAKRKRKLKPLQDVAFTPLNGPKDSKASSVQDDNHRSHEQPIHKAQDEFNTQSSRSGKQKGQTSSPDQLSSMPSASLLPEKRILELIIDILQRKDSHEIFAEPVDPDEVEDYYEIIKEPMDFGTMRAKLHEGMYNSLGQFEHDIFLITGNAMHFNTSGTIYFRQARAIDDLAKKVFHSLKSDPKNFEMEFSGTRRRSGRRPLQDEAKNSMHNSSPKLATNSRFHSRKPHSSPKRIDSSTNGLSVSRKNRLNSNCSVTATTCSDSADHGLLFDGRSTSSEADRRSSYKPQLSFLSEKHFTPSTSSSSDSKLLVHVNQHDIGYCKSLMMFTKDLGPTAQMIAKRKMIQCSTETANFLRPGCASVANNSADYMALTSEEWNRPTEETTSTVTFCKSSCSDQMEMSVSGKGKGARPCNKVHGTLVEVSLVDNSGDRFGVFDQKYESTAMEIMSVGRIGKFQQNLDNAGEGFYASATSDARDFGLSVSELISTDKISASLKRDKSKLNNESPSSDSTPRNLWSNSSQWKLHDNHSLQPSSRTGLFSCDQIIDYAANLNSPHMQSHHQISADEGTNNGVGLCERRPGLKSSEDWKPVSRYIFDLPFLKNRFEEKNHMEQDYFLGDKVF